MNEAQRRVLNSQHGQILKHLVLDTDILGYLVQHNVLTETMVQTIQAKTTQHDKITELLVVLPKRGPKAFPVFMDAVRKSSQYLFDKLQAEYEKEQKKLPSGQKETELTDIQTATPVPQDIKQFPSKEPKTGSKDEPPALPTTPRDPQKVFERSFIRTGPKDLTERRHSLTISSSNQCNAMTGNIIQQNLNTLYIKLKTKLQSSNQREHTFSSPEPASFKMVDKLIDELFQALDEYETSFSQCHALLGGKDRNYPLMSHIINLQKSKKELEGEVKAKDQQKNKYGDHISKLENRCRNQTTEINHLNEEIKRLKEDLEKLEAINCEREEKQKIIDELRKMVMDADTSKKSKLRSSYLALHYDSNSTEIKQLRAEVRSLRLDNENLKTENLMLKKSENLKKLAKLREDQTQALLAPGGSDERDSLSSRGKHRALPQAGPGPMVPSPQPIVKAPVKRGEAERPQSMFSTGNYEKMSADSLSGEVIVTVSGDKGKFHVQKSKAKEQDYEDLDFKFSNSQNGSLGQKRSPSKERTNKRVTFLSDLAKQEAQAASASGKTSSKKTDQAPVAQATVNGQVSDSDSSKGNGSTSKAEKTGGHSSRKKQSHLKTKASSKRSASLNSLTTSRDIMKMSSHLIQKSRNLRNPNAP